MPSLEVLLPAFSFDRVQAQPLSATSYWLSQAEPELDALASHAFAIVRRFRYELRLPQPFQPTLTLFLAR